jgi:flavin-dependent dehydrogenase
MNPFGHGFHLNRMAFDESLRRGVIDTRDGISGEDTCVVKATFKRIEKRSDGISVVHVLMDGQERTFFAKWVIDATGRKASLATKVHHRCFHFFVHAFDLFIPYFSARC